MRWQTTLSSGFGRSQDSALLWGSFLFLDTEAKKGFNREIIYRWSPLNWKALEERGG